VDYRVIPGAGHFFNNPGETELMSKYVGDYLYRALSSQEAAA
jgi:hypothetical protein